MRLFNNCLQILFTRFSELKCLAAPPSPPSSLHRETILFKLDLQFKLYIIQVDISLNLWLCECYLSQPMYPPSVSVICTLYFYQKSI